MGRNVGEKTRIAKSCEINELLPMILPIKSGVLLPKGRNPLKDLERATRIELATPTLATLIFARVLLAKVL
jgi:hypothetical protein